MKLIKKPFEIPYNFKTELIDFLQIYTIDIHCIYLPPFEQDYPYSAKYGTIKISTDFIDIGWPTTREEYAAHVGYVRDAFPDKLMLLLQSTEHILSEELLWYYISLGFSKFCVGTIKQAQMIRKVYPEAEIIGSIAMKIDINILNKNLEIYYDNFDGFVLWFPFNRNIEKIKKLPKGFKYILLINCHCTTFCEGTHHWFISQEEENTPLFTCPKRIKPECNQYENIILVRPDHLKLFDNYISYFKLQGREQPTKKIIKDIIMYTTDLDDYFLFNDVNIQNTFKLSN